MHDEHDASYRFGKHTEGGAYSNSHQKYGSGQFSHQHYSTSVRTFANIHQGATGGAGFGNKSKPDPVIDNEDIRFGSHESTAPYSGGHPRYGSGSTGGAGFGNKTKNMDKGDSAVGKMMEKVGGLVC